MLERIREYIIEHRLFSPKETVLVGFSGGADSLCLLYALFSLQESLNIRVTACHVHHMLRETADRDAAFCEKFCAESQIPFLLKKVNVPAFSKERRLSTEEGARILRYRALEEAAQAFSASKIALAHHADDQAETVLFQMIRGSALKGLSGMQPRRGKFVRPLLFLTKEEILSFLTENGLSHVEDETNALPEASRNRLRLQVLPALREIRPDAAVKIAEAASYVSGADDFIRQEAERWISENVNAGEIPAEPFSDLHPVLREYIITELLRREDVSVKDVGRIHIDQAVSLAEKPVGKKALIPRGAAFVRTYEGILLLKETEIPGGSSGHTGESAENGGFTEKNREEVKLSVRVFTAEKGLKIVGKECTKWFSYDKIKEPVVLRHREPGDVFAAVPGSHKKLKEVLIDEKIPREARERLWVVASGKEVLWIVGGRMNEDYKISEDTKEIMEITISEERI